MKRNIFWLIAFLFVCSSVDAAIYKWKDANGNWHFSEDPPPNTNIQYEERNEIKNSNSVTTPEPESESQHEPAQATPENKPDGTSEPAPENEALARQISKVRHSLVKINAATKSGVIWKNYVELVNGANFELSLARDKHTAWQKQQGIYEKSYYELLKIYDIYDDVKTIWGMNITAGKSNIKPFVRKLETKYNFRLKYTEEHTKEKTGSAYVYDHDKVTNVVRQKLWVKATALLDNYQ